MTMISAAVLGSQNFWYRPSTPGRYQWKVTAKDARGSTSESAGAPYFDFVKP